MNPAPALLLPLLLASLASGVSAAGPAQADALDARRAALAAERETVLTEHARAVSACRQRFAVTPCIEAADEVRRRALERVQAESWKIDEVERLQRAEQRRRQRESRAAEHAQRLAAGASGPSATASAPPALVPPRTADPAAERARPVEPSAAALEAAAQAREAEARQRAERLARRQHELAQRQARIRAREAERAASGAAPAPLPRP